MTSIPMASQGQLAIIHMLVPRAGMNDDDYRSFVKRETGKVSAKELTRSQAGSIIEKLRDLSGESAGPRGAVAGLDGPVGTKLRALWISGYNLGIVTDRTDRAMLAFLQRQTGVSHVRFLQEPRSSAAAIEGMKAWLERQGGVEWPSSSADVFGSKVAVLEAQWRRLIALRAVNGASDWRIDLYRYGSKVAGAPWASLESHHLDQLQVALGRKLRSAREKAAQS